MLSSWGLNTADYILYTLVSGIWSVFALLGLPVLALLVMTTVRTPGPGLITGAAVGLALPAAAAGLGLLLHSQVFAVRAGHVLQRPVAMAARLAHRPPPANVAGSLAGFRDRAGALLAVRGGRITVATVASNLTLWLVLLACLRGIGLSQAQVPWQTSLMAFAFIRLLTALPLTPGGVGITELGLVGILAAGAGHRGSTQVTAAVLLYRAITYLPPIPLGAIACLIGQHAPALIATSPPEAALTPARLNGPAPGSSGFPRALVPGEPGRRTGGRNRILRLGVPAGARVTGSRRTRIWGLVAAQAASRGGRVVAADACVATVAAVQVSGAWLSAARGAAAGHLMHVTDEVSDLLHVLTDRSVLLLDVAAAGLLLADPRGELRVVAASSEAVLMTLDGSARS